MTYDEWRLSGPDEHPEPEMTGENHPLEFIDEPPWDCTGCAGHDRQITAVDRQRRRRWWCCGANKYAQCVNFRLHDMCALRILIAWKRRNAKREKRK